MPLTRQQHKDLLGALRKQAAYKTGKTNPLSAECYSPRTLNIRPITNEESFEDHTGRSVHEGSVYQAEGAEWDTTFAIEPSGTSATAADWAIFFAHGFFTSAVQYRGGTTISGAGGVNSAYVSNASGLTALMGLKVEDNTSTSSYNMRLIVEVSAGGVSGGSGGRIVWAPALSAGPSDGNRVGWTNTYAFDDTANDSSFTLWQWLTTDERWAIGAVGNNYTVNVGGNKSPVASITGFAREYRHAAPTTLASAITTAVGTKLRITDADNIDAGATVKVSGGEIMTLGYKYEGTSGIFSAGPAQRGLNASVATSHLNGATVAMNKPIPTLAGSPIPSPYVVADVSLTSSTVARLEGTDATLTFADAIVPDEQEFGDAHIIPSWGKGDGDMKPMLTVTGKLDETVLAQYARLKRGSMLSVALRAGKKANKTWGAIYPNAVTQMFEHTDGDGKGSVACTQKWEARAPRANAAGTSPNACYIIEG